MSDPSPSPVLGIDLGTTFSSMAVVDRFGKPVIVPNAEGHPTTPSMIHFYERDACVVGEEALKMVVVDPTNVARFIKRAMGDPGFTLEFFGRTHTPQELSAIILRKLREDAEEILGTEVQDAVITVPAYFNSAQRGATAEAGAIAGLNVLSIVNEPTAAAIAFGLERMGGRRRVMVFDLGGGTFDVTLMEMRGVAFRTLASDGNAELGGKDWDDRLLNHAAEQFERRIGLDPRDDLQSYQELYERCLQAKIALSTKPKAVIPVNHRGHRMVVTVTREQFEHITRDLVDQTLETSELVLARAGMAWANLDEVLLVGGSTRMPMVRQALRRRAGRTEAAGFNPEEGVALGAALAGVLRHRPRHPALTQQRQTLARRVQADRQGLPPPPEPEPMPQVSITDVTSHPLGIVVLGKDHRERVVPLIAEGTPLPCEKRGRFAYAYDNMTAVRVEATEGHGTRRSDVKVVGEVILDRLPPRPRGTAIDVVYRYGVNQILEIDVVDVSTGNRRSARIQLKGGMDAGAIEAARRNLARAQVT